jgi:hypothetical protein
VKVFSRIEVWLLLVLLAGAGWFVRWSSSSGTEDEGLIKNLVPVSGEAAVIRRGTLERDHGNARLDLEVRVSNKHAKPVQLVPPFVVLRNASGREVPGFFLPVEPPPSLPAGSTADVKLRFWLDASDLVGALQLELDGATLPVKTTQPVDLASFKNLEPSSISGAPWGF